MSETNNNHIFLEKISRYLVMLVAFLMPLFFLPTTTEFFQFNKLALLTISTILLLVVWAFRIIAGQRMELTKSVIDLPLLAFTGVTILSTIFSLNKDLSLYGGQGRWFPSLFGVLTLVTFYYTTTPLLKSREIIKSILVAFTLSNTISTLIALLGYYGVYLGGEVYFRTANFTLTGSVTTTLFMAALSLVTAILLSANEENMISKVMLNVSVIINFFFIALLNQLIGWAALGVGVISIFFFFDISKIIKDKFSTLIIGGAVVAIVLINILPATRSVILNENYPAEVTLPIRDSWIVSTSVIQTYPLLATGPSTFQLNFPRYRSIGLNAGTNWGVRYDKPYNELFNIMASLGIVGTAVAIYFSVKLIKLAAANSKNSNDESGLSGVLSVALIMTVAGFLFTYATVLNTFTLFLILSLLVANHVLTQSESKLSENVLISFSSFTAITSIGNAGAIKKEYLHLIVAAPMLLIAAYAGFTFYKLYAGEFYMRQSIIAALNNQGASTYELQGKAINISSQRDSYHTAYAQTNLALANLLAAKPDLTDEEKATIQTLIAQSIRSSRVATEVVSPLNVRNWETRALVYKSLLGVAQNAGEWAVSSYNAAIQLDPTNPALRLDLGNIYFNTGDYLTAANYFRQSVNLKPDYANAHYNFAQALLKLNDYTNAKRELETTKGLIPQGSEDFKRVEQEIAAINTMPEVAGIASDKPTVEEIAGPERAVQNATQEPLTNPGEAQNTTNQNLDLDALPPRERGTTQEQQNTTPSATQPANN